MIVGNPVVWVGVGEVREWIIANFGSFVEVLLPLCFLAFFVGTAIAIAFNRRRYVRRTYVAGFFAVLVTINLVGLPVLPMMYWHKFSEPRPESQTHYEFRLVDADGDELVYDGSATLAVDSVTLVSLQRSMLNEYSHERNERIARYLVQRAREHRMTIRAPPLIRYLQFPPHGLLVGWDRETLQRHSAFVGLRLYRINITTTADGTELTAYSEEIAFEFYPDTETNAGTDMNASTDTNTNGGKTTVASMRTESRMTRYQHGTLT